MSEVTKFANKLGIDTGKLLGDWIVCIPGFTLQKYRQLQRSQLSIFSIDCFGGFISHTLGLPFRSPFVNLFLSGEGFIKFLRFPHVYLNETPIYTKHYFNSTKTINYPVGIIGDISIYMLHYKDFDEAVIKWNERKHRINCYNIFVKMHIENPAMLE